MSPPVALTQGEALLQKFTTFWKNVLSEPPNDLELRRFERDAGKIQGSDPEEAYLILGMIAALRGDEAETRACFDNALRFAPRSSLVKMNYSVALLELCRFEDAEKLALEALANDSMNLTIVDNLARSMTYRGRIRSALEYVSRWQELKPDEIHPLASNLKAAQALIDVCGLNPEEVARMFEYSLGQAARIVPGWKMLTFDVCYPDFLSMEIIVDADADQVVSCDWALAQAKAEANPPFEFDVIYHTSISFRSWEV